MDRTHLLGADRRGDRREVPGRSREGRRSGSTTGASVGGTGRRPDRARPASSTTNPVDPFDRAPPPAPCPSRRGRGRAAPSRPARGSGRAARASMRPGRSPPRRPWPAGRARPAARSVPTRRGDVEHEVLVGEVPARAPCREGADARATMKRTRSRTGSSAPIRSRTDSTIRDADRHVPSLAVLPDVVQQRAQRGGDRDPRPASRPRPGRGRPRRPSPVEDPGHRTERAGEMRVHREPVVRDRAADGTARRPTPVRIERAPRAGRGSRATRRPDPRSGAGARTPGACPASQTTSPEMSTSSIESRSAADGSRPASASVRQGVQHADGRCRERRTARLPPRGSVGSPTRRMNSTWRACSNSAAHEPVDRHELRLVLESHGPRRSPAGGPAPAGLRVSRSRGGARCGLGRGTPPRPRAHRARGRGGVPPPPAARPSAVSSSQMRMQVAPPAGPFLEVGLQQVRGGTEAFRPAGGVVADRRRERLAGPAAPTLATLDSRVVDDCLDPRRRGGMSSIAAPASSLPHASEHSCGRANRVPHLEPRVPERIQQRVGESRHRILVGAVVQDEQVDVGARQQEPAPVPARPRRRPSPAAAPARSKSSRRAASTSAARRRAAQTPVVSRRVGALERCVLRLEGGDGVGGGAHATARARRGPSRPSGSG